MNYTEAQVANVYKTGYEDAISDMVEFIRGFDEPIDLDDLLGQCEDLIAWSEEFEVPEGMLS